MAITFPEHLPIAARVADLARAIDAHPVVVVAGATGSGKTTQLPKIALAMGRGLERTVGVTQPRRLAATSVAARVAEELGTTVGADVGYQVRFDDRTSPSTYVKFMTDGILLAEIQGDPLLRRYDTLIVDEAHERSLTIDFLLGWLKRILPERPDLKVVVSSATLETARFSEFFGGAPVVEVEGRTFPVDVLYEPPSRDLDLADAVAEAVGNVASLDPDGDVLVFLPGEREIRDAERAVSALGLRRTVVQPLYARLTAGEQAKVFARISERRVILATNVAETSITLPGVVYVVDPGLVRLSRYDPRSGTTRLQIEGVSQASAEQRKGRCGRVREGICIRLYDEPSFAARPAFTDPEIKRTGLAGVILRMKALGLGDVEEFPFLDPPKPAAVTEGYRVLEELGALDDRRGLTELGRRLARLPVDPRLARMILAGADLGCLAPVLAVVAGLSVPDVRERPREHAQKADELHRRFRDERSDFVGLLKLWTFLREEQAKGTSQLRRTCGKDFLSFVRVREWFEVHRQLEETTRELGLAAGRGAGDDDTLHRALLTGLLSKVGTWQPEKRSYLGARQTRFALHPSSALAKKPPAWVMAFELVETTQLFARTAARVDPAWLLEAAPQVLRRTYADPHWSEASARAVVREHVSLFGLSIAKDRTVPYAPVAPAEARRLFLEHALARGEYRSKGRFAEKNRALLGEVARLRDKARASDMIADDDALVAFFDARVPAEVVDGKTFEAWREGAERARPDVLALGVADVLVGDRAVTPADYPDEVVVGGAKLAASYVFDPSADDDGLTLTVPLALVPQLDPRLFAWTIPGWHEEKLLALLHEVPRAHRRGLDDPKALAPRLAARLRPFEGPFGPSVARALQELTGVRIDEAALRPDAVAPYLRTTVRVVGERGELVAAGRDLDDLFERTGARAKRAWEAAAPAPKWERTGLVAWDFGALPASVERVVSGARVRAFPALVDRGRSVDLVLLESEPAAADATRRGALRLALIASARATSALVARFPRALARPSGAQASRVDDDAFRSALLLRVAELAFGFDAAHLAAGSGAVPRDRAAFDRVLEAGGRRLPGAAKAWTDEVAKVAAALDKLHQLLRTAARQPSGRLAVQEVYAQLEGLVPADLIEHVALPRLEHLPRYLRAAQVRVERAIADPRKDAAKAEPLRPLYAAFGAKLGTARDREGLAEVRWLLEELRVATFAPELKTPVPVSAARVAAALAALR